MTTVTPVIRRLKHRAIQRKGEEENLVMGREGGAMGTEKGSTMRQKSCAELRSASRSRGGGSLPSKDTFSLKCHGPGELRRLRSSRQNGGGRANGQFK